MLYTQPMVQLPRKKLPYSLIAATLVLAVLGTCIFFRTEIFHDIETIKNKPYSNSVVAPVDHAADWLAENTITVNRIKKVSSPSLWNGTPRAVIYLKTHSAADYSAFSSIHAANPYYFPNCKNTISLKLRI